TDKLARGLANADYAIVSGLARGIDLAAHRASLATGTIAVLAGGHARPYPAEHAPLLEEIAAHGAIVTEMPLEWEPRGRDFPRRNRIVSGLCAGTVVVEAARRSGSLITARFAAEQGREIFAVPGSPLDPRAEGANDLLRQGATLCTGAEDVIAALAMQSSVARPRDDLFDDGVRATDDEPFWDEIDFFSLQESGRSGRPRELSGEPGRPADVRPQAPSAALMAADGPNDAAPPPDPYALVLSLLGPAPVTVDALIRSAGLPARDVHGVLLELDLAGRLERHGANLVSLL
ncbi:MAG: DNA-protecting protein DprA, partial [Methylocystis sp.]|nr:DNA-protecting protein DprA [Methylocystis sp.]